MDLFSFPARRSDPQTSVDAARLIEGSKALIKLEVLSFARLRLQGFTDWDLCEWFRNHSSTYRTRRAELTQAGLIVATDERRKLPSGRMAVVWKLREAQQ